MYNSEKNIDTGVILKFDILSFNFDYIVVFIWPTFEFLVCFCCLEPISCLHYYYTCSSKVMRVGNE